MRCTGPLATVLLILFLTGCTQPKQNVPQLNQQVHTFYYGWYGNPEQDGQYHHWSHDILPHWSDTTWDNLGKLPGGEDIGANFYPELGCYSSNDTSIIRQHMEMMVEAGIGVVVLSWWGKGSYEDKSVPLYLEQAESHGLKIAFHVEPFYKNAAELKPQLDYIAANYGGHAAVFKPEGKPFFYLYDSYKLDSSEWQKLLSPKGALTIRNTPQDATCIGLWVNEGEGPFFTTGHFDGFYTYFASQGFVYGSSTGNWPDMAAFARKNDLMFIPCPGPGYIDTRIRPWNAANTKDRQGGQYYEDMFQAAVEVDPAHIAITSFNEWHEGSQIEPAVSKSVGAYQYEDYGELEPDFYLRKTRELVEGFTPKQAP